MGQNQKNTQEPDMNQLRKVRREKLAELQQNGRDPFQITKFNQTHHSLEVKDLYEAHEAEILKDHQQPNVEGMDEEQAKEALKNDYEERRSIMDASPIHVAIAGRMMFKRVMGKASFCNIQDLQGNIQVYVARDAIGTDAYADFKKSDIGDIFGLEGFAFRTRTGEISIHAEKMTLLSKSLQMLPEKFHGLTDTDTRYRQRYVDLIMNADSKDTFIKRSKILAAVRKYLSGEGFMEVETPMLVANAGGAAARPDPPASGDHRYAAHLQQPALHRQGAKDHRSRAGRQHGGAVSTHVHGKNERRQAALRRRHRSAVGCRAQIPAVCPSYGIHGPVPAHPTLPRIPGHHQRHGRHAVQLLPGSHTNPPTANHAADLSAGYRIRLPGLFSRGAGPRQKILRRHTEALRRNCKIT